jgi:hypothetical protein
VSINLTSIQLQEIRKYEVGEIAFSTAIVVVAAVLFIAA